jgi:hypothetical protein
LLINYKKSNQHAVATPRTTLEEFGFAGATQGIDYDQSPCVTNVGTRGYTYHFTVGKRSNCAQGFTA